jgi:hypothetical protein
MKRFFFLPVGLLILLSFPCDAQQLEPLNRVWLADDYRSMELISLLATPAPLTTQKIMDILDVSDKDDTEEDLGFGANKFNVRRGHGYTSLSIEAFVFRGSIGSYKLELDSSPENWTRIRERMIELWREHNGPSFEEGERGLIHIERDDSVLRKYQTAVSTELGEMKPAAIPAELQKSFDSLTGPMEIDNVGSSDGEMAIAALVNTERFDLVENVLRGFNPNGRIYAARELLKLNKEGRLSLSADSLAVIAKISNLDIQIRAVSGCLVDRRLAREILEDTITSSSLVPKAPFQVLRRYARRP